MLGMSWIKSGRVCLDVKKGCLLHEGREHAYRQLSVLEVPLHLTKVAVYANKRVVVPPGGRAELQAAPFNQGHLRGIIQAKLESGLMVSLPIYLNLHVRGELAPWTVQNTTTAPMTVEAASQIETWTAIQEIVPTNKLPTPAYACFQLPNLNSLVKVPGLMRARLQELLAQHCRCFSIDQYDVSQVGPPYRIKLRTGTPYKGYVPRQSPAAIAAIQREVKKMKRADFMRRASARTWLQWCASLSLMGHLGLHQFPSS